MSMRQVSTVSIGIILSLSAARTIAASPVANISPTDLTGKRQFFERIDQIADEARFGAERLLAVWPVSGSTITPATTSRPLVLSGGRDQLDAQTTISASTVEFSPRNPQNVSMASLSIEGICITHDDLKKHYAEVVSLNTTRPDKPSAFTTVGAYGSWGLKRFTFQNGNRCLVKVAFQPTPILPKAFPDDSHNETNPKSSEQ